MGRRVNALGQTANNRQPFTHEPTSNLPRRTLCVLTSITRPDYTDPHVLTNQIPAHKDDGREVMHIAELTGVVNIQPAQRSLPSLAPSVNQALGIADLLRPECLVLDDLCRETSFDELLTELHLGALVWTPLEEGNQRNQLLRSVHRFVSI